MVFEGLGETGKERDHSTIGWEEGLPEGVSMGVGNCHLVTLGYSMIQG